MTEDEKLWKAVTDTVIPLGSPGGKRKPLRAFHIVEPREIDLHGLTVQKAFLVTREFLENSEYKQVIIITGKSGQIKLEFERWLANIPRVKRWMMINEGSYTIDLN